ncbi:hypothetical protein [Mucilaginibacter agri]|uniref:Uncharacterized protein n=1 Tax=Mucilaginibacter agri TaxID=2695265 RepID=A0A965ZDL2_9SPHI|nr:hypothetical protein [Mucilaginibacter agri]NCD68308.1 hypothetical protein [Mucilaginibacter agri]
MAVVLIYDFKEEDSYKKELVKAYMIQCNNFKDKWSNPGSEQSVELPGTTLWTESWTSSVCIKMLEDACKTYGAKLDKVFAVNFVKHSILEEI